MKPRVPIIPAINPCIKKPGTLCEIREKPDSNMICDKDEDKYCCWREKTKDKINT